MNTSTLFPNVRLAMGSHPTAGAEMCAMEMVAWLNGESHSDHPSCSGNILGGFVMALNDGSRQRQRLIPYIPRLIGTAGDEMAHYNFLRSLVSEEAIAANPSVGYRVRDAARELAEAEFHNDPRAHNSIGWTYYRIVSIWLNLDPFEILDRLIEAGPTGEFEPKRNPLTAAIELNMVPA